MSKELKSVIKKNLQPLRGDKSDYDSIIEMAKDSRFVLIGESTHGTKEFYKMRSEITKRLITELGFSAVTIEGDWPDAYHINRYVNGTNHNGSATTALSNFERFPTWMWQNKEVLDFIKWLRGYNIKNPAAIRFYGLDLYSMNSSISAVIEYLDKVDPKAAALGRQRYSCLDNFTSSPINLKTIEQSCEMEIVKQLIELREHSFEYIKKDGFVAEEEFFCTEQNAILIKNAQQYYRSLYYGEPLSWNLRDSHMAKTLDDIAIHLENIYDKPSKIVVWAHNSHIGDARATEMAEKDELNLGQIMREKYGEKALLIGFSTYQGTVSAASDWDRPVQRKTLLPAVDGSIEQLLHQVNIKDFILDFRNNHELAKHLKNPLLQRFVGVIYHPKTEYMSHYYHTTISEQFDALIYLDETSALEPLKVIPHWHRGEMDETYPFGL